MSFIRLLLVFFLPPVAVYMQFGVGHYFWISVILTLLGFVPGLLYSLYIMAARTRALATFLMPAKHPQVIPPTTRAR